MNELQKSKWKISARYIESLLIALGNANTNQEKLQVVEELSRIWRLLTNCSKFFTNADWVELFAILNLSVLKAETIAGVVWGEGE